MKTITILAPLLIVLTGVFPGQQPALAQNVAIPPQPQVRRQVLNTTQGSQAEADLSRNYRLTVSLKIGDQPAREIVLLTASAQIRVSAVLGTDEVTQGTTTTEVSGILAEKDDGRLRLSYQLGASVPVVTQTSTSKLPTEAAKTEVRTIQYVNESASGVLVMEPCKPYEIFKSATRSYTLTVQPETAAKGQ